MLAAINRLIDRVEETLVVILIFTATVVAIIQVVARYVFNNSLYWSEELILYALITMSFLAASMGVRHSAHISVEAVYAFVGPRSARILRVVAAVLGLIFAATLVYYGTRLHLNTAEMGQLSPAMQIPVAYIYLSIPVAGTFMLMRYLQLISGLLKGEESVAIGAPVSAS